MLLCKSVAVYSLQGFMHNSTLILWGQQVRKSNIADNVAVLGGFSLVPSRHTWGFEFVPFLKCTCLQQQQPKLQLRAFYHEATRVGMDT
jgi:hypothetical protein